MWEIQEQQFAFHFPIPCEGDNNFAGCGGVVVLLDLSWASQPSTRRSSRQLGKLISTCHLRAVGCAVLKKNCQSNKMMIKYVGFILLNSFTALRSLLLMVRL